MGEADRKSGRKDAAEAGKAPQEHSEEEEREDRAQKSQGPEEGPCSARGLEKSRPVVGKRQLALAAWPRELWRRAACGVFLMNFYKMVSVHLPDAGWALGARTGPGGWRRRCLRNPPVCQSVPRPPESNKNKQTNLCVR